MRSLKGGSSLPELDDDPNGGSNDVCDSGDGGAVSNEALPVLCRGEEEERGEDTA